MSAVLDSEEIISVTGEQSRSIQIREGDWKAYLQSVSWGQADKGLIEQYGGMTAYKRACALAYLGRRAQIHGGVCSSRHPHIMTAQFIAELEQSNRNARYTRYPWLRSLMTLLAEIEQIQDQISGTNVITLVPASR